MYVWRCFRVRVLAIICVFHYDAKLYIPYNIILCYGMMRVGALYEEFWFGKKGKC